ncbi:MAG: exonuclease domain-containing protein [Ignavibacteria bacterium]|nr:exonuclease domain-containing protein [Ignavibacteria bacterium]
MLTSLRSNSDKITCLEDITFSVVDVETTGMNPVNNRITEIGVVKVKGLEIISEYRRLVNPKQFIPPSITRLTGISNEMVASEPTFDEIAGEVTAFISEGENVIFTGHNVRFDYRFLNQSLIRSGYRDLKLPTLCTARLARRIHSDLQSRSLNSLKRHYKIYSEKSHRALEDAKATATLLIYFIDYLASEMEMESITELLSFQYRKIYTDENISSRLRKLRFDIRSVPECSGVYFMHDRRGGIVYIGKAKNLRDRLSSYFYHNLSHSYKIRKLLRSVYKITWEVTNSELSALIYESKLIKKHKPRFNSAMKRFRTFPFVKIDRGSNYPRVLRVKEITPDKGEYFGPFSNIFTADFIVERINRKFRLRKCREKHLAVSENRTPCMYYEFGQCLAPCDKTVSKKEYANEVWKVSRFMHNIGKNGIIDELVNEMMLESENLNFEKAAVIRDYIDDIRKVTLNTKLTNSVFEFKNCLLKCYNHDQQKGYEIFLVSGGKLATSYLINPENLKDESFISQLIEKIDYVYFKGTLFRDFVFSGAAEKFSKGDSDVLKIITNWIYRNFSPKTVLTINKDTQIETIKDFIIS